jgi:hypothetical protein
MLPRCCGPGLRGLAGHSEVEDLARAPLVFARLCRRWCSAVIAGSYFRGVGRTVHPDDTLRLWINVKVNEPETPGPLTNTVTAVGGGVPSKADATVHNTLGEGAPAFGFGGFSSPLLGVDGEPETQAGGHPYELASKIEYQQRC